MGPFPQVGVGSHGGPHDMEPMFWALLFLASIDNKPEIPIIKRPKAEIPINYVPKPETPTIKMLQTENS